MTNRRCPSLPHVPSPRKKLVECSRRASIEKAANEVNEALFFAADSFGPPAFCVVDKIRATPLISFESSKKT
jgi:hypothetical protein